MSKNNRDPKYSGWPGPEPKEDAELAEVAARFAPHQVDLEEAVAAAPKKRKLKVVDAE